MEFQNKPQKKPNYKERVRLGIQSSFLRKKSKKQIERDELEKEKHNKNIEDGMVFCAKCGRSQSLEKHHYKGRKYPDEFVYLCNEFGCGFHAWIHSNENRAYELGWLHPEYRGLKEDKNWPKPWL